MREIIYVNSQIKSNQDSRRQETKETNLATI